MKITQLLQRRKARRQIAVIRAKTAGARRQLAETDAMLARREGGAR